MSIEYKNNDPLFYTGRARAYIKIKEYSKAKADCQAALLIDAKFLKAYKYLSESFMI